MNEPVVTPSLDVLDVAPSLDALDVEGRLLSPFSLSLIVAEACILSFDIKFWKQVLFLE